VTRVDFYILEDVELDAMQRFACRLASKAVSAGNEVHIHTSDASSANDVDELLWDYPEHRFIPHVVVDGENSATSDPVAAPVTVGWDEPTAVDGVLINLSHEIPGFFGRFDRVAEIIVRATRDQGRERYRFYRDRGYPLFDHKLDDWEDQ
jgi:DNA polymerase-3 subunit chi